MRCLRRLYPLLNAAFICEGYAAVMIRVRAIKAATLVLAFLMAAPALAATQLTGAGSTFDFPFFSKAFYQYSQTHSDVEVNYQSIGSGGGIQQFTARTVDFGATDVPMDQEELKRASGPVVQVPVALGGVAIVYNLQANIKGSLKLTPSVLAGIYLGKITSWNDPAIAKLNAGTSLPATPIVVVHRSDGSGTTYIFTDYLSHVSAEWKSKVGTGKSVQWPAGSSVGGKGNEGVAGVVRQTPGAIGYNELAYVLENKMTAALLENRGHKFVACTPETVAAAARAKPNVTATDFSIVDEPGTTAYPIAGYSWVVLYEDPSDKNRARLVRDVIQYLVTGGQQIAATLNYVPLPRSVQDTAQKALRSIHV